MIATSAPSLAAPSASEKQAKPGEVQALNVTVRSANRRQRRAFRSTRSISVVERERIVEQAPKSLADALRFTPSVSVQQTTPGQGTIIVRGLSGRALYHAVDGVRLNAAIFRAGNNPYLGLVDPYALESVEIVPGASSVRYGSEALAGAVLFTTALPGYSLGAPQTSLLTHQSVTSNPLGTASRFEVKHAAQRFTVSAGVTYLQAGAVRPGEGMQSPDPTSFQRLERLPAANYAPLMTSTQRGTEFSFVATNLAARRRLAADSEVVARAQFALRPELVRYDQIVPRFKNATPSRAEAALDPMYRAMTSLSFVKSSHTSWYDRAALSASWQRLSEREVRRGLNELCFVGGSATEDPAEACAGVLRLTPADERIRESNRSDAFGLKAELDSESRAHDAGLHAGAELGYDRVTSSALVEDTATRVETPGEPRFPNGSSMIEAGLFGELSFRPAKAVTLTAGGRGSLFFLDVVERGGAGEAPAPGFQKTLADGTATLGARWEFAPGVAWLANIGRGVRAPNIQDFATLGARARGRFQLPNSAIGSEHTTTLDSGVKVHKERLRAQTVGFFSHCSDPIVLAPTTLNGSATNADGDSYYWSENAGSVELWGLDSAFELQLMEELTLLGRWLAMLGTQKNPPELGLPEETPADRVPPHQGELGLRLAATSKLELSTVVAGRLHQQRLNDPTNLDDNRIPEGGTPGYATFHARASYALASTAKARLSLDNLTNRLVLEHGSGFYRPGFSATVSIDLMAR